MLRHARPSPRIRTAAHFALRVRWSCRGSQWVRVAAGPATKSVSVAPCRATHRTLSRRPGGVKSPVGARIGAGHTRAATLRFAAIAGGAARRDVPGVATQPSRTGAGQRAGKHDRAGNTTRRDDTTHPGDTSGQRTSSGKRRAGELRLRRRARPRRSDVFPAAGQPTARAETPALRWLPPRW